MALRNRLTIIVVVVCAVWITPFLTSSAQAATHVNSRITTRGGNHCVAQIAPLRIGQVSSDILSFTCYKTLSESIAAATGGSIQLPTRATGQDVGKALQTFNKANPHTPNGLNIIAIFYIDANYGGNSYVLQTSGPPCSSTNTYGLGSMPNGWSNDISSIAGGYYGCTWYRIWPGTNYTGANQCFANSTSYVGNVMNDRTNSIYFRISDPC